MHEVIRGGTYRDVTDGTLVRVSDTYTDLETNQTIIAFAQQADDSGPQRLPEVQFLERYSLVV